MLLFNLHENLQISWKNLYEVLLILAFRIMSELVCFCFLDLWVGQRGYRDREDLYRDFMSLDFIIEDWAIYDKDYYY